MLCCDESFVTATYEKVGLIPQDSRALPLALLQSRKKTALTSAEN
jgi:hypothetical protein